MDKRCALTYLCVYKHVGSVRVALRLPPASQRFSPIEVVKVLSVKGFSVSGGDFPIAFPKRISQEVFIDLNIISSCKLYNI